MANFDKPGSSGFDKMAANPAAPAGLKQGAQRFSEGQRAFFGKQTTVQPWSPSSPVQVATQWYSGANVEEHGQRVGHGLLRPGQQPAGDVGEPCRRGG